MAKGEIDWIQNTKFSSGLPNMHRETNTSLIKYCGRWYFYRLFLELTKGIPEYVLRKYNR